MKFRFGSFLSGVLCATLVFSLALSAFAISGRMTIEVDPINIQVNGKTFAPTDVNGKEVPVFAYQGTTYAPVRALAEAYGLEVGYDAATNMATVGEKTVPIGGITYVDRRGNSSSLSSYDANVLRVLLNGEPLSNTNCTNIVVDMQNFINVSKIAEAYGIEPTLDSHTLEHGYVIIDGDFFLPATRAETSLQNALFEYDFDAHTLKVSIEKAQ